MLKNEFEFVYLRENCISKEMCNDMISKFDMSPRKYYGVTSGGYMKSSKNTIDFNIPIHREDNFSTEYEKELWLSHSEVFLKTLGKNLKIYREKINNKYKGVKTIDDNLFTEIFLFHRYVKGEGVFIDHSDNEVSRHGESKVKERILTYLFYLNDVEEGGETIIGNGIKIKPKAGSLLLFPACWTYPHKGETPLSSDKYIITGWLHRELHNIDFSKPPQSS